MARPVGTGALSSEIGTFPHESFAEDLYAKVPQDMNFTYHRKQSCPPTAAINTVCGTTFDLGGMLLN